MIKSSYINPKFTTQFDYQKSVKPHTRYVIFSQQRSGSSWLSNYLIATGKCGVPAEYFNERAIGVFSHRMSVLNNPLSFKLYLDFLESIRTSSNGIFGLKVQPRQIFNALKKNELIEKFLQSQNLVIFLSRRDKLSQAISVSIAQYTGIWSSYQGSPYLMHADLEKIIPKIASNINRLIQEDELMKKLFATLDTKKIWIDYEDLFLNPHPYFEGIQQHLGLSANDFVVGEKILELPQKTNSKNFQIFKKAFMDHITGLHVRHEVTEKMQDLSQSQYS